MLHTKWQSTHAESRELKQLFDCWEMQWTDLTYCTQSLVRCVPILEMCDCANLTAHLCEWVQCVIVWMELHTSVKSWTCDLWLHTSTKSSKIDCDCTPLRMSSRHMLTASSWLPIASWVLVSPIKPYRLLGNCHCLRRGCQTVSYLISYL